MNIDELTPAQKSKMLATVVGWRSSFVDAVGGVSGLYHLYEARNPIEFHKFVAKSREAEGIFPNLYDPTNMYLAWRVLNWAMTKQDWLPAPNGDMGWLSDHVVWLFDEKLLALPPAEAQTAWLDKILELAIEANITPSSPI